MFWNHPRFFFPWYIPSNESANCVSSPFQSVFKLELPLTAYGSTTVDQTTKISGLDDYDNLLPCLSSAADLNITAGEIFQKLTFNHVTLLLKTRGHLFSFSIKIRVLIKTKKAHSNLPELCSLLAYMLPASPASQPAFLCFSHTQ